MERVKLDSSASALDASSAHHPASSSSPNSGSSGQQNNTGGNRRGKNNNHRGKNGGGRGQGGGGGQGTPSVAGSAPGFSHGGHGGRGSAPVYQQWNPPPWWAMYPSPWAMPPSPFPTQPFSRPGQPQQGVLGPRPPMPHQTHQAYNTGVEGYTPTDIAAAMHTLTLNPPDPNWYMDSGATAHMTSSSDQDASDAV